MKISSNKNNSLQKKMYNSIFVLFHLNIVIVDIVAVANDGNNVKARSQYEEMMKKKERKKYKPKFPLQCNKSEENLKKRRRRRK